MTIKDGFNPGFLKFPGPDSKEFNVLTAIGGYGDFIQCTGDWGSFKYLALLPTLERVEPSNKVISADSDDGKALVTNLDQNSPGILLMFETLVDLERFEKSIASLKDLFVEAPK